MKGKTKFVVCSLNTIKGLGLRSSDRVDDIQAGVHQTVVGMYNIEGGLFNFKIRWAVFENNLGKFSKWTWIHFRNLILSDLLTVSLVCEQIRFPSAL